MLKLILVTLTFSVAFGNGECPNGDPYPTIGVDFENAVGTHFNLNNRGDTSHPEENFYENVGSMDGNQINLKVTALDTTYRCQGCGTAEDILSGQFGKIKMLLGTDTLINFAFVDNAGDPVALGILYMTFCDLDGATNNQERLRIYGATSYAAETNTYLTIAENSDGNGNYVQAQNGVNPSAIDNPTLINQMTNQQKRGSITVRFDNVDNFNVWFSMGGTRRNQAGRSFLFAGVSYSMLNLCLTCEQTDPPVCDRGYKNPTSQCNDAVTDLCDSTCECLTLAPTFVPTVDPTDPCAGADCSAESPCFTDGTCTNGVCSTPFAVSGVSCDDTDANTENDVCDGAGNCSGTPGTTLPEETTEAADVTTCLGEDAPSLAIDFANAEVLRSNLGGKHDTSGSTASEIYYQGIGMMSGRVDLRLTTSDDLQCKWCGLSRNVAENLGVVSLLGDSEVTVTFSFVDESNVAVTVPVLYMAFYDLDGGRDAVEEITLYDIDEYFIAEEAHMTVNTDVANEATFSNKKVGHKGVDNPHNLKDMTTDQKKTTISARWRNVDSFQVKFKSNAWRTVSRMFHFGAVSEQLVPELCKSCRDSDQCAPGYSNPGDLCNDGTTDVCDTKCTCSEERYCPDRCGEKTHDWRNGDRWSGPRRMSPYDRCQNDSGCADCEMCDDHKELHANCAYWCMKKFRNDGDLCNMTKCQGCDACQS